MEELDRKYRKTFFRILKIGLKWDQKRIENLIRGLQRLKSSPGGEFFNTEYPTYYLVPLFLSDNDWEIAPQNEIMGEVQKIVIAATNHYGNFNIDWESVWGKISEMISEKGYSVINSEVITDYERGILKIKYKKQ